MLLFRSLVFYPFIAVTTCACIAASAVACQAQDHSLPQPPKSAATAASKALTAADAHSLKAALANYDAGRFAEAQPTLLTLAQRYPRQFEIQAAAGMTLAELGKVADAIPYLRVAHRLAPQQFDFTVNLAVAEVKTGHPEEAIPLLRAAVDAKPGDASLRLLLAESFSAAKQPAAAADAFATADRLLGTESQTSDEDLRHDWAVALLSANRAPEAITVLQAAPAAETSAPIQELLAEAEEKSGHYEQAVHHFRRAAELDPSESNLYAYSNELLQHWTFPAAIDILTFATSKYPTSQRLQMALGVAYFGNGNYDKAVPVFGALLARTPDSAAAADLLGRSCSASSGQQPDCASLKQFAQAHPNNAPAALYAATAILHQPTDQQDTASAEALLRQALRVNPALPEAWYQLAILQQSRNDWPESAVSLQRALTLRPSYPEAHYRLARAYSRLGKRDEAQQQIALQQKYAADSKAAENKRMQEVITFITTAN